MKKALSLLLSVLLTLSCLGTAALADGPDGPRAGYEGKTVILYTGNVRGDVDVYPKIAAMKQQYLAQGADVILADVGNYLQGSAIANASRGEAVYTLMDAAGYDVAGMGLAEFGYADATTGYPYHGNFTRYYTQAMLQDGTEEITYDQNRDGSVTGTLAARDPAAFQTVCSNVLPQQEGVYSFAGWVDVETESGLVVRFLGKTDPAIAEQVQDGYLAVGEAPMPLDNYADVTVLLSNLSIAPEVDAAAVHMVISVPAGDPFTAAALVMDNNTREFTVENFDLNGVEGDPAVAALVAAAKADDVKVVGKSEVVLNGADSVNWNGETNLGDLTADALKWYAEHYIDGLDPSLPVVAIQNGGNCDAFLYTGEVTEADLLKALPFSPMGIGVLQVTGAQLLETLEAATQKESCPGFAQVAGLTYNLDATQDYDGGEAYGNFFVADSVSRVTITGVGSADFDPDGLYNLVCDNFLINGNDTYYTLKNAKEAGAKYINNGNGVKTRDAVALYVQQVLGGVIGQAYAAPQGRITNQVMDPQPDQEPVQEPEQPAPSGATYTVKAGDCLWVIAARELGSGQRWNELYQANQSIIKDPSLIYVGQVLTLPQR